jgi:8-amino-7-oxononanoate synthase
MRAADRLEERVRHRLAECHAAGLSRTLRAPAGVDLSSNDYLGLSRHQRLVARLRAGVAEEGCGSTGSRLLRGQRDCFDALERRFARFKNAERALYFSSGYLANLAVMTALVEPGDEVCSDAANHASLIDGIRLSRGRAIVFPHNDVERLADVLARSRAPVRVVVVESLFSMDGDMAPLAEYAALCCDTGAALVVDEAHAVGVYGARGSGLLEAAGVDSVGCVSISTAGKALGVSGAFVAGPAWAIDYLEQKARPFVFTTAAPPALAHAIDESLAIVDEEPERRVRLLDRSAHLRRRLAEAGIGVPPGSSQIVPIHIGDNGRAVAVAAALQREGFDVRAIRPPSVPAGTARLRVSVNAGLSEAVLDSFVDRLSVTLREAGICSAVSS